jgi:magnesium transporter
MNIPLPGGIETGAWTFLGPYTTLVVICAFSGVPVLLMYWLFRRKKWL